MKKHYGWLTPVSKKASVTDIIFIMSGLFATALTALIVALVVAELNTEIQEVDIIPTEAKRASTNMSESFPGTVSGGIVALLFFMVIISLALAALIPVHPAFIVFYAIEWLLLLFVCGALSNAYQDVIENPLFAGLVDDFALTTAVFRWLPFIAGVLGATLAIIMYKVKKGFLG